ncbi:MAG TPA: TonB-dependent receptor [Steroidobacteraceae bacterium]|nr:TonB-dependent receptor [Steroidobacteraceae bacterium]
MNHEKMTAAISAAVALALAAAVPWGVASAQNATDQGQNAQATAQPADQGGALQEVVVTAERRATDVQTTPISVEAVSGAQLSQDNITQMKNLQLYVPSVTIDDDGLYQSFNIRGIGNQAITPDITTGVAVLVDGLFSPETHGLDEPFYDIQDTEVLRGPQGTFVGYSSTGGALEITTQDPNFRGTNGYAELDVGNFNDKRLDGAVNFVLTPTFAVRLAFNEEQRHSFYRDNGSQIIPGDAEPIQDPGSVDNKDMRLSMLWKPTDSFKAELKLDWNSSDDGGDVSQTNQTPFTVPAGTACAYGSPTLPGPKGGSTCYTANYVNSSHLPYVLNWGPQAYLLPQLGHPYTNYRLGLHLDYTLPDGIDIRSVTGFQQTQYDTYGTSDSYPQTVTYAVPTSVSPTGAISQTFNSSGAFYQWIPRDDYYSEELDVLSRTDGPFWSKFNWIAGGTWFYRDTGVTVSGVTTTPPYSFEQPFVLGINDDDLNRIAGLFGQISWQIVPSLQLQVGARENWDNNPVRATVDEVAIPGSTLPAFLGITPSTPNVGCVGPYQTGSKFLPSPTGYFCAPAVDQSAQYQDKTPTGKIDLNWTPLPGQFFYAFFARGYKAGGAAAGAPNFEPEHVNDWELGWKGTMLNGHVQTHLGGYYMDYQSMQQPVYNILTGTANEITNIGSSTLEGIEATLNARLGGFGFNFDGSYEHSRLGSVTTVAAYQLPTGSANEGQCGLPGVSSAACFLYGPYEANLSGESDIFAPELEGTIAADYRISVGLGTLDPQIMYSYTAHQYASLFQIPYYYMGPRHIWNASLTYNVNQWNAELYLNNFTNEVYLAGNSGAQVFYGAPEQIGIRVRRDF